jgi:CRISPR-associated endonuclease Cas2
MLVLVSYDVSTTSPAGKRRLHVVAKACENFGIRVQNSVFECDVDPAQWERLKVRLLSLIEVTEDSLERVTSSIELASETPAIPLSCRLPRPLRFQAS